jgi:hypothetical protein
MSRLPLIAVACFVLGVAIMVPFDAWYTIAVGLLLLFSAIVTGVFAIATPEFLGRDDEAD